MSKFGWSYPPGVTESMLPGNSAADQAAEAMADKIYEILEPLKKRLPDTDDIDREVDEIVVALMKMVNDAHGAGYADGSSDTAMGYEARKDD